MKKTEIQIPDMQSTHCQTRVYDALKDKVHILKLEAGKIAISLESDHQKEEVIRTIEKAGYTVSRDNHEGQSCCTPGSDSCSIHH